MKLDFIDKVGSLGTFFVAASCPVCWPLFIPIGSALGLGFLQPFEGTMMNVIFPTFVFLALIGSIIGFSAHRSYYPLTVSCLSVLLIVIGFYGGWHLLLMYIGIIGLLVGSVMGIVAKKQCKIQNQEQGIEE